VKLVVGHATDVGRVREGNEDSFLVDERLRLFAVADGMGGHRAGEVASATALEALRAAVASGRALDDAIASANDAVYAKAADDSGLRGMGTTLTAVVASGDGVLVVGHVGDSRAYLVHGGELDQITEDHSLVEELVREGRLTPEQAVVHPQRSIITRALGIDPTVEVDVYPVELRPGDRILLCSDGLTTMVRPVEIATILRREPDPGRAADLLVDAANAAGGEDNITTIVVAAVDDDPAASDPAGSDPAVPDPAASDPAVAPMAEPTPRPAEPRPARRMPRGTGRRVGRLVLFLFPVLAVLGLAFGAVGWYARRTFFVGIRDHRVVVFRGVPGGLLGWDPTVERRTGLDENRLDQAEHLDLVAGHRFSSKTKADQFVAQLERDVSSRAATSATTSTTTTAPLPRP